MATYTEEFEKYQRVIADHQSLMTSNDDEDVEVQENGADVTRPSFQKYLKTLFDENTAELNALVAGRMFFETIAELNAVTSPTIPIGQTTVAAEVLNDETLENNGLYVWDVSETEWVKSPTAEESRLDDVETTENLLEFLCAGVSSIEIGVTSAFSSSTSDTVDTNFWTVMNPVASPAILSSLSINSTGSGTGRVIVVSDADVALDQISFDVGTGLQNIPLGNLSLPTGSRAWLWLSSTSGFTFNSGGETYLFPSSSYTGIDSTVDSPTTIAITPSFAFTLYAHDSKFQIQIDNTNAGLSKITDSLLANGIKTDAVFDDLTLGDATNSGSGTTDDLFYWSPQVEAETSDLYLISAAVNVSAAGAGKLIIVSSGGVVLSVHDFLVNYAGINTIDFDYISVPTGSRVFIATDTSILRYYYGGDVSGSKSLYFSNSGNIKAGDSIAVNYDNDTELGVAFDFKVISQSATQAPELFIPEIVSASISTSETDLTITATINSNGFEFEVTEDFAYSLCSATYIRYDLIVYDAQLKTLTKIVGAERQNDPSELIPAVNELGVYALRISDTDVKAVPLYGYTNGEPNVLIAALDNERRRSRKCLQRFRNKVRRQESIKIMSFGDSIVALQDSSLGSPSEAVVNGEKRDRTYYYSENIGSDIVSALPLYTSIELGRADDGAGAVHHKTGFMWSLASAVEGLGCSVVYDNFGIGGQSTAGAVDGSDNTTLTPWTNNALAIGADLVVINLGMNERGNTETQTRLIRIINAFKSAGADVLCMGVVRPQGSLAGWEYTNNAIYNAAKIAGAAFLPTIPMYDSRYIGALGIHEIDVCSANNINHPGIREHAIIGRALSDLALED